MPARRRIALENLRRVYGNEKSERELQRIMKKSVSSFLLNVAENVWFRRVLDGPASIRRISEMIEEVDSLSDRAKAIHDSTGGCIFITPHLGCYTLLPYLFAAAGIPLTIPIQELGNEYIHQRWWPLNGARSLGGEIFVPKTNSLAFLRASLRHGRSLGIMADQRTMRGLAVEFMGATALTTPIPAMLAVNYRRPIVVGACCRRTGTHAYELMICEPIWPDPSQNKKADVVRMTRELNRAMESIIRAYPEQYLWVHNRWKPYSSKKKVSSKFLPAEQG